MKEQAAAERLGEANATLMRSSWVASNRDDQGFGESFDVLGVGVAEDGLHRTHNQYLSL